MTLGATLECGFRVARPAPGRRPSAGSSPPGLLGRNQGGSTGAVLVAAHVACGAVLGLGAALGG